MSGVSFSDDSQLRSPVNILMRKPSETALDAQHRLRRIEGRHNPLVKQLRQAFSRAELTESGDCAIEGLRILEEAIRSGLRFSAVFFRESAQDRAERLLPQIGAQVETLLLPDKLFDSLVPSESPQGVAALVRFKEFSLDDVHGERTAASRPDRCARWTAGSRQSGYDSAFVRGLWQRRRGARRRHGEPLQLESCARLRRIGISSAHNSRARSRARKVSGGKAGGSVREAPDTRCAPDRDLLAQGNAAGSSRLEGSNSDLLRERRRRLATGCDG